MIKNKQIYDFRNFAGDLWTNLKGFPTFARACSASSGLDPQLREKIMVSISRMNECRHCTAIHGKLGEMAGLTDDELAALQDLDPDMFDRSDWVAIEYARRLAAGGDENVLHDIRIELETEYSDDEIASIEAVARGINMANRCGNTWDAFLDRIKGEPVEDSSVIDELLVLATLAPVGPLFLFISETLQRRKRD